jgi:hypothetical protein
MPRNHLDRQFAAASLTTIVPLMVLPWILQWYLNSPSLSNVTGLELLVFSSVAPQGWRPMPGRSTSSATSGRGYYPGPNLIVVLEVAGLAMLLAMRRLVHGEDVGSD